MEVLLCREACIESEVDSQGQLCVADITYGSNPHMGPRKAINVRVVYAGFLGPYLHRKGQFSTFCIYQPALPSIDSFNPSSGPGGTSNVEKNLREESK